MSLTEGEIKDLEAHRNALARFGGKMPSGRIKRQPRSGRHVRLSVVKTVEGHSSTMQWREGQGEPLVWTTQGIEE